VGVRQGEAGDDQPGKKKGIQEQVRGDMYDGHTDAIQKGVFAVEESRQSEAMQATEKLKGPSLGKRGHRGKGGKRKKVKIAKEEVTLGHSQTAHGWTLGDLTNSTPWNNHHITRGGQNGGGKKEGGKKRAEKWGNRGRYRKVHKVESHFLTMTIEFMF